MIVGHHELVANGVAYEIGVHDDGRFDVSSRDLPIDHLFLTAERAAELLQQVVDDKALRGLESAGVNFRPLLRTLRMLNGSPHGDASAI